MTIEEHAKRLRRRIFTSTRELVKTLTEYLVDVPEEQRKDVVYLARMGRTHPDKQSYFGEQSMVGCDLFITLHTGWVHIIPTAEETHRLKHGEYVKLEPKAASSRITRTHHILKPINKTAWNVARMFDIEI